ncbi:hypothetical protein [Candidatus Nitrosocosmicus sp. SS]|uniref:hypothetical protein n=1 Tax=Candidatus Nitrosocosmicus agrestis TaxID=2563600 RepID=UPI00122DC7A2|nr:hypothetical protein [Candidatus Nitrosocosmicus sp. SS]KAA2283374.1 hypothetical protein F1Z66_02450 [Candidatus Nitrosocosmicus sp. SS]KAF0868980.1 hypothetical protein E5N71_08280 [Candidatus Nitrosocosmicus sp. SS]
MKKLQYQIVRYTSLKNGLWKGQTHGITGLRNSARYEKKDENYLSPIQFSCCIIIYRKLILG